MLRTVCWVGALVVVLAAVEPVQAQYGGYGWGGWGNSVGGSRARGLGNLYAGRGVENEENAVAGAINTNTTMRWNNALYQSSRAGARRYADQNRAQRMDVDRDRAAVKDRIENHPEELDITDGNTLNALMTEILSPANADRSLQTIKTPLQSDIISNIPFEDASEDITFCLHQMTMEGQWPLALSVPAFQPERAALHQAMANALAADEKGTLDPGTIAAVTTAVANLQVKFEREVSKTSPDYHDAMARIRTLGGLTKMLHSPKMDEVLAELDNYKGATLGDLLAFMQSFNLRFAPASSFRQKAIYRQLYPMLKEQVQGEPGSGLAKAGDTAVDDLKSAATDLFNGSKK